MGLLFGCRMVSYRFSNYKSRLNLGVDFFQQFVSFLRLVLYKPLFLVLMGGLVSLCSQFLTILLILIRFDVILSLL